MEVVVQPGLTGAPEAAVVTAVASLAVAALLVPGEPVNAGKHLQTVRAAVVPLRHLGRTRGWGSLWLIRGICG